jgi:hypothetical protein
VAPSQPWLDGVYVGEGVVRQMVAMAMPLGSWCTVEAQVTFRAVQNMMLAYLSVLEVLNCSKRCLAGDG